MSVGFKALPLVVIVTRSPLVSDVALGPVIDAIQRQVSEHLAPAWGVDAELRHVAVGEPSPPGAWIVSLVDTCDDPSALGCHQDDRLPSGIVGVKSAIDDGYPWSSVLSHEVLELVVDPWADVCRQAGDVLYALEVCDAVEGAPYMIEGVEVENFVLPSWFRKDAPGPWDHRGILAAPLSLAEGGYDSYLVLTGQWAQDNAEQVRATKIEPHPRSRRGRRRLDLRQVE